MTYALFLGCNIPARLTQYESSARAVLDHMDLSLMDIPEFNCCGYPVRNIDHTAFVLAGARNLALAAKNHMNVLCLCKCCYGSLKKADHLMKKDPALSAEINGILSKEGLAYNGTVEIKHLLGVLFDFDDVGIGTIKKKVKKEFTHLKIATHYGCHALRPSTVVDFDDPVAPSKFDKLVEATGAKSVDWSMKLDCCGAPVWGINDDLSLNLTQKKLEDAKKAEADFLCTACPYCQMQFDTVQEKILLSRAGNVQLPSLVYPQLLGLSMGIDSQLLGLSMNRLPIAHIDRLLRNR